MQRYVIACDFSRPSRAAAAAGAIRKLASQWEHPLASLWIVQTGLSAEEIRTALVPHLDFQDRVYVTRAQDEAAGFNAQTASGSKVTPIGEARTKSRMLTSIFGRNGKNSRHLTAATAKSLKSA